MKLIKQITTYILIPLLLLIFAVGNSLFIIFTYKTGITVLPVVENKNYSINPQHITLLKGNSIYGRFTASQSNLGEIVIRLHNYNNNEQYNEDKIIFRIKEHGSPHWYFEHTYLGTQFYELNLFPFGIPIISNSNGKIYDFQITSLNGNNTNSITLDNIQPQIITEYQLNKHELMSNKKLLMELFKDKLFYALYNHRFGFSFIIYFLPLIVYFLLLPKFKKFSFIYLSASNIIFAILRKYNLINETPNDISLFTANLLIIFVIFIDIFIVNTNNNITIIIVLIVWIATYIRYKLDTNISFILVLLFLFLCPILLILNQDLMAQKAAIWVYIFLLFGVIKSIYDLIYSRFHLK